MRVSDKTGTIITGVGNCFVLKFRNNLKRTELKTQLNLDGKGKTISKTDDNSNLYLNFWRHLYFPHTAAGIECYCVTEIVDPSHLNFLFY